MPNILTTIVNHKRNIVANSIDRSPQENSIRDFKAALSKSDFGFIMECKKASPSKGLIRKEFNLEEIVPIYNKYADAISVLTEERFFQGSFANLHYVSQNTSKPVLCKDFILEPKQIRQARYFGADAILLMLSILSDDDYRRCAQEATKFNMDILTEVHTEQELQRAVNLGSQIIGINNRDLKNLSTSFKHTEKLAQRVPNDTIIITESGIRSHEDIWKLSKLSDACLVGSALMSNSNLELASSQLVYGDIKICGVTNQSNMALIENSPASSVGVIFAESSKRAVESYVSARNKKKIGVFQNQSIGFIQSKVKEFDLQGIQLHGSEGQGFINDLRRLLGEQIFISKAVHVNGAIPSIDYQLIDELLLDTQISNQQGGTGHAFNWELLNNKHIQKNHSKIRIAGGLTAENIQELKQYGFSKIDICTGSESTPGIKCLEKVNNIFKQAKLKGRINDNA